MEKKDIIILVLAFVLAGFSLYRKYIKKKEGSAGSSPRKKQVGSSLKDQADDYEPYSGSKS
jgi:hypothetical protein